MSKRLVAVDARVVANSAICREHVHIEVVMPAFPESEPGQFLELQCANNVDAPPRAVEWPADGFPSPLGCEWHTDRAFLRRPFSIADRWSDDQGGVHLTVISRAVGRGTKWLERRQPGDLLNLTGPLGRGFRIPERRASMVLVGGGGGIPPLLYLARRLHESGRRDVIPIFGATTHDLLPLRLLGQPAGDGSPRPCAALPGAAPFPAIITTEDGSIGLRGLVTDGLVAWHERRASRASSALVFACGPEPMLRAVAAATRELSLDCQLCIERNMGCGMGTCLSCVVRLHDETRPGGWRWALACLDGPVFQRDQLLDYDTLARP